MDLETAVANGCVSVAIEADQDSFQYYSSGILTANCGTAIDHGMSFVSNSNKTTETTQTVTLCIHTKYTFFHFFFYFLFVFHFTVIFFA